jgi:hypothetical protein
MHIELTLKRKGNKVLYPIDRLVVLRYECDEICYVRCVGDGDRYTMAEPIVESYEQVKHMLSIVSEVVAQSE